MALAVFFLLVGLLFAEIGMIGFDWANLVGAASLGACAMTLFALRPVYENRRPSAPADPAPVREPKGASSSVTALRST